MKIEKVDEYSDFMKYDFSIKLINLSLDEKKEIMLRFQNMVSAIKYLQDTKNLTGFKDMIV